MLQNIARKFIANSQSKMLKDQIKEGLKELPREEDRVRRRARMLLQSAGWLDIDKLIEHRPPIDDVGFWKRPMPPQRKLKRDDIFSGNVRRLTFFSQITTLLQRFDAAVCSTALYGLHRGDKRQHV